MKKSLCYITFIFFLFISFKLCVYADTTLDIVDPFYSFSNIDNYGLQGFTVVKDKLFIVLVGNNDTESIFKIYDLKLKKEIKSIKFSSVGHANDVAYNSKTNEILVVAGSGSHKVLIFDGDTFEYKDSITLSLPIRSMTYIYNKDKYAVRTVANGYFYNNDYSLFNKFPFVMAMNFETDVGRQGWEYYNDYLYYATWSWIRLGGDGSNTIYVYDLDGNLRDKLHTLEGIGELECVSFYDDKMILGFNGYDERINFYISDIPDVPEYVEDLINEDIKDNDKINPLIVVGTIAVIVIVTIISIIFKLKKKHG